ncbi:hypothetical protein AB2L28_16445 [Kineococcus sp. TBRC 1896]|uniref:Uncharacterized protein n=1 Tax=Kineococcus mangrovi TaxID=1660183 RepID=A0ABV4I565_9ACTN
MVRPLAAAGALVCVSLLTACSGSSASARLHGPLLVSDGRWDSGMAAALGGQLARVGPCIGLGESMVVWPDGVSWDEDAESLVLPDSTPVGLGDDVSGGGGSMTTSSVDSLCGPDAADALRECGVDVGSEVIVFNVGSSVSTEPVS